MSILYKKFFERKHFLHCKNIKKSLTRKNKSFIDEINFYLIEHKIVQQITSINICMWENQEYFSSNDY